MRRQKSIRRLPPNTRKLANYINDIERSVRRLNKLLETVSNFELENIAWQTRQKHFKDSDQIDPLLSWKDKSMLSKISKGRS